MRATAVGSTKMGRPGRVLAAGLGMREHIRERRHAEGGAGSAKGQTDVDERFRTQEGSRVAAGILAMRALVHTVRALVAADGRIKLA